LKIKSLNVNKKSTLYKALIRSIMPCACLPWEFAADSYFLDCSACKTKSVAPLVIYQSAYRPTICRWPSKFGTY